MTRHATDFRENDVRDRHRQGQEADQTGTSDELGHPVDRLAVIRRRLERGFYDDASVAMHVARRLLASGDLTRPGATP